MADPMVSVCIIARNEAQNIGPCLQSLLQQTSSDFEILIVDDHSADETPDEIARFKDKRIRYFRNERNLGIPRSRNRCIEESNGRYLFFTDADCVAARDWLEKGLKALESCGCNGVEGKLVYVSESYRLTIADNVQANNSPGNFMVGNIGYTRAVVEKVGGFDENYVHLSDRNLGLKVLKAGGRIDFCPEMVVYHSRELWTPMNFVRSGCATRYRVPLFKEFGDKQEIWWRIVSPRALLLVVCPPATILSLFIHRYRSLKDFRLLPFIYLRALCARIYVWRECIRLRVLLI